MNALNRADRTYASENFLLFDLKAMKLKVDHFLGMKCLDLIANQNVCYETSFEHSLHDLHVFFPTERLAALPNI